MIKLAQPDITEQDILAVVDVLRSGQLVADAHVQKLERAVARYVGTKHAVAVSNGTVALTLALQTAGVGPGDEVIVPDFTFIATGHAVALVGATPIIVDVDMDSWNISVDAVKNAITSKTKAIMPVDQFGLGADINALKQLRRPDGSAIVIVEDAACALGATHHGVQCGAGVDLACYSFHPRKIVTTGEGGMVVTDNDAYAQRLRALRSHGRDSDGRFIEIASNQRLPEMAGALGLTQLSRLDSYIQKRRELARCYIQHLTEQPLIFFQKEPSGHLHTYQTFAICLDPKFDRNQLLKQLGSAGIQANIASYGLHLEKPYSDRVPAGRYPVSAKLSRHALALPMHTHLTEQEVSQVCKTLLGLLG